MGGGAFILLKVGHCWPETAKQAEIRLANLVKILRIAGFGGENTLTRRDKDMRWLYSAISAGHG